MFNEVLNRINQINEKLNTISVPNITQANQVIDKADKTLVRTNRLLTFLEITIPIVIFLLLVILLRNLKN
jgi:hypothetical protein